MADMAFKLLSFRLIDLPRSLFEENDHVRTNFGRFKSSELHAVTWNEFPWIGEPSIKGLLVPDNGRFL